MNNYNFTFDDMSDLWYCLYKRLISNGELVHSRIGDTKHITDVTFCLTNPTKSITYNSVRKLSAKYMIAELLWYLSGSNKIDFIGKYAKMWNSLTDDGETVNSAYGYRIFHQFGFDQLKFCIDKLKANKYDRQAVIHIKDASNKPTKDTPCTCLIQFTVMEGKLNAHTYMRSNDIWFGTPYDVIFFTLLQQIVSRETGIPLGKYYHTVGDMHVYTKNIKDIDLNSVILERSPFVYNNPIQIQDAFKAYLEKGEITEYLPKCILDLEEVKNLCTKTK